jgi:hypothetical protein
VSARWTDETEAGAVEAWIQGLGVATNVAANGDEVRAVRTMLGYLADAGLLLIDDEDRRQYGVRLGGDGPIIATAHPDWTHYRLVGEWREVTEEAKP